MKYLCCLLNKEKRLLLPAKINLSFYLETPTKNFAATELQHQKFENEKNCITIIEHFVNWPKDWGNDCTYAIYVESSLNFQRQCSLARGVFTRMKTGRLVNRAGRSLYSEGIRKAMFLTWKLIVAYHAVSQFFKQRIYFQYCPWRRNPLNYKEYWYILLSTLFSQSDDPGARWTHKTCLSGTISTSDRQT